MVIRAFERSSNDSGTPGTSSSASASGNTPSPGSSRPYNASSATRRSTRAILGARPRLADREEGVAAPRADRRGVRRTEQDAAYRPEPLRSVDPLAQRSERRQRAYPTGNIGRNSSTTIVPASTARSHRAPNRSVTAAGSAGPPATSTWRAPISAAASMTASPGSTVATEDHRFDVERDQPGCLETAGDLPGASRTPRIGVVPDADGTETGGCGDLDCLGRLQVQDGSGRQRQQPIRHDGPRRPAQLRVVRPGSRMRAPGPRVPPCPPYVIPITEPMALPAA